MKTLKKKLLRRLKSRAGESIAEVLVAVLIFAIGMATLAGMVAVSSNMVTESKQNLNTVIEQENRLAQQQSGEQGTVKLYFGSAPEETVNINYYSETISGKTVVSYQVR